MILYILQLTTLYYEGEDKNEAKAYWEILKNDPYKMKEVFGKLASKEGKFIGVWKVFEIAEVNWKTGGRGSDTKFETLLRICSSLMVEIS